MILIVEKKKERKKKGVGVTNNKIIVKSYKFVEETKIRVWPQFCRASKIYTEVSGLRRK